MTVHQLKVVLWKNVIIRKRHWILTICEAVVPIVLFLLIAYGRSKVTGLGKIEVNDTTFNEKRLIQYYIDIAEVSILYSPENDFTSAIIQRTAEKFQIPSDQVFGFYNSDTLLEDYPKISNGTIIAIIFDSENRAELSYTIRYSVPNAYGNQLPSTSKRYYVTNQFTPNIDNGYMRESFVPLQTALDLSFIELSMETMRISRNMSIADLTLSVQEFPYPPHKEDSALGELFKEYLPLLTLFSFMFLCPTVLQRVVEEKNSGAKELLKMVGMTSWMIWLGWFIYAVIPMLFSISCIVFLMKVPLFGTSYSPIEYTSASVFYVFLLLYCTTAISFCFAISGCFRNPAIAVVVGLLIWLSSYFIPTYSLQLQETMNSMSWFENIILNLLPNMTLQYGYSVISVYEEREVGVQWYNFHKSSSGGSDDVTMLNVFVMLLLDTVVYVSFTFYMDGVNPGKYGLRKSMGFPLKYLYSLCRRRNDIHDEYEEHRLSSIEDGYYSTVGIGIRNLRKTYCQQLVVDIEKLDIYKNHITVLLGHNGAGKSTTMSMITGMTEPTSGMIEIDGLDSRESQEAIRDSLGLCPQHNLLFTDLTVREHLIFFAKIKGKSTEEAETEMDELLDKMNMSEKKNVLAHTLSGGMKRKLCLGMALIGGSKVLILDEPSSGMDPESRRHLWDLLLSWRGEKTILISTHFMEEADALGDWIAIMSEGNLQCHGTPMDLKKKYHTGYRLSLMVSGEVTVAERAFIGRLVERTVCNSQFKSDNGNEMIFVLPFQETTNITKLLSYMEENKCELKIENISISTTTLEDVFLKTRLESGDDYATKPISGDKTKTTLEDVEEMRDPECSENITTTFKKSFFIITKNKCSFIRRNFHVYAVLLAISIMCLLSTVYLISFQNGYYDQEGPKLELHLSTYKNTSVFYDVKYSRTNDIVEKLKYGYDKLVQENNCVAAVVSDVQTAIIEKSLENIAYYKEHMVASASFNYENIEIEAVALYNPIAVHSLPISVNLVTNAVAKTLLGPDYSISASNWPLPSINQRSSQEYSQTKIVVLWLVLIPIGCLFIQGSFILFPHTEISTKFIQMQYMCGLKSYQYWLTNYVTDLLMYFIVILLMSLITYNSFPPMNHFYEFRCLLLIFMIFGLSGIPYSYLFCRKGSASGSFSLLITIGILLGIILTLTIKVLLESQDDYYIYIGDILRIVSVFFLPQVGLSLSLVDFSRRALDNYNLEVEPKRFTSICSYSSHACCDVNSSACANFKDYLQLLGPNFLVMLYSCLFYLSVLFCMDSYRLFKFWSQSKYQVMHIFEKSNDDYKNTLDLEIGALNVNNLSKSYSRRRIVDNINLSLKNGHCLGILGVNGAGKTTTFKMLTREEVLDNGSIRVQLGDKEISIDNDEYIRNLGYCPQSDNLNFVLTGRQILTTIADLRNVDKSVVEDFLTIFDLKNLADIPCGHYSGGNKRKLSLAVSLIGFCSFILLDEPTNGMDPSSRRKCWNIIKDMQNEKKRSFILTSHSMTECEALCDDLKIMKEGKFVVGNKLSLLKQEYGGYGLKIKLKSKGNDEIDDVKSTYQFANENDLIKYFTNNSRGEIKDNHGGLLCIYIKKEENVKRWSQIFTEIESIKEENPHLIEDYSISEASLEDIFLKVSRSSSLLDLFKDNMRRK